MNRTAPHAPAHRARARDQAHESARLWRWQRAGAGVALYAHSRRSATGVPRRSIVSGLEGSQLLPRSYDVAANPKSGRAPQSLGHHIAVANVNDIVAFSRVSIHKLAFERQVRHWK